MGRLKVGVVGVGVGRIHLKGYKTLPHEVEVVALCDLNEARLNEVADEFNVPLRYTDNNQLFQSGEIEAVSICLPNSLHVPVSVAALEAGLHVLCEKPLAESAASGEQILEAAARAKGKFMMCFNRRYRPDVLWMKQLIEGAKLGQIYQVKAGWIRETGIPARTGWFTSKKLSGGGPLIDLGVHMLDMVMWLLDYPAPLTVSGDVKANFGSRGRKVWHTPGSQMPAFEVEDLALAFVRLNNGVSLSLETSWASHARPGMDDFFVTIMGTEATVELYVTNYTNKDTLTFYTELNGSPVTIRPSLVFEQSDHAFAVAEFVRCIKQGLPPTATAEQGLTIMRIIDAIYQSAAQGREVVLEEGN